MSTVKPIEMNQLAQAVIDDSDRSIPESHISMQYARRIADCLILAAVIVASCSLLGCASNRARNTTSLLAAAGFHTLTPQTPQQQACFAALPPYKLVRTEMNGKVVYAYADKKRGIAYVGGEKQNQEFHRLALQQQIANQQLEAAQMNQNAAMNWGFWGPPGVWW